MGFFNLSKKETVAAINIRDGSVGGILLSLDKNGKSPPEKLFSTRQELVFQKNFNYKRLFYATAQGLSSVVSAMLKSSVNVPQKIFCTIGPHLYVSQTRIIRGKYSEPLLITEDLINKLIRDDLELFLKTHIDNGLIGHESANMLLEHKIMQIKLNGYETFQPIGKRASEIEISVFVSMIPKIVLNDLKKIISKNFHSNNIIFHSFTFVLSDVVRGLVFDKSGFVLISIEDEITEIVIIRNGIIEETVSFPLGRKFLLRMIIEKFNTVYEGAVSFLKMYTSKAGDPDAMRKISQVLKHAEDVWSGMFYQTMQSIATQHLLPEYIYSGR